MGLIEDGCVVKFCLGWVVCFGQSLKSRVSTYGMRVLDCYFSMLSNNMSDSRGTCAVMVLKVIEYMQSLARMLHLAELNQTCHQSHVFQQPANIRYWDMD